MFNSGTEDGAVAPVAAVADANHFVDDFEIVDVVEGEINVDSSKVQPKSDPDQGDKLPMGNRVSVLSVCLSVCPSICPSV